MCSSGRTALDNNELDKAEAKAAEALRINPRLPSALRLKSDVCYLSGRLEQSLAAANAALAVNPHDEGVLARVAACALLTDGVPSRSNLETWLAKPPVGGEPKTSGGRSLLAGLDGR